MIRMPHARCRYVQMSKKHPWNRESWIKNQSFPYRNSVLISAPRPQPKQHKKCFAFLARMKIATATNWIETMPFVWNFKGIFWVGCSTRHWKFDWAAKGKCCLSRDAVAGRSVGPMLIGLRDTLPSSSCIYTWQEVLNDSAFSSFLCHKPHWKQSSCL